MTVLTTKKCVPCEGGVQALTPVQAQEMLTEIPGWELGAQGKSPAITRRMTFGNFSESLTFVNKVGVLAEEEGHHPDITFGWGYAVITLYTHAIDGLHENDFIMAAKINSL